MTNSTQIQSQLDQSRLELESARTAQINAETEVLAVAEDPAATPQDVQVAQSVAALSAGVVRRITRQLAELEQKRAVALREEQLRRLDELRGLLSWQARRARLAPVSAKAARVRDALADLTADLQREITADAALSQELSALAGQLGEQTGVVPYGPRIARAIVREHVSTRPELPPIDQGLVGTISSAQERAHFVIREFEVGAQTGMTPEQHAQHLIETGTDADLKAGYVANLREMRRRDEQIQAERAAERERAEKERSRGSHYMPGVPIN